MGKTAPPRASKKEESKKPRNFVPKWEYWAKAKLASYCSEDGVPFHVGPEQDEKKFLQLDSIRETRDAGNEELFRRLGMGLTLDASSVDAGFKLLARHFAGDWPDDVLARLSKTGLVQLKNFLASSQGSEVAKAISVLNVGKSKQPDECDVKKAVKTFVTFATGGTEDLVKHLGRLASSSAVLYLCSMTLLKDLALFDDLPSWAKSIEGKQSKAVQAWAKRPGDKDKLRAALVQELMAKIRNNHKESGKKRRASDSSVGGTSPAAAASSSSSTESSSPSDPKPAKRKGKTSSSSDKKAKKKDKKTEKKTKTKKTKKEKKSDRRASCSPTPEEPKRAGFVSQADRTSAAFTTWAQGDVQLFVAEVGSEKGRMGNIADSVVERLILENLLTRVPENVRQCFPVLHELQTQMGEADSIPGQLAKKVLTRLTAIASEAEAFWEEQSGAGFKSRDTGLAAALNRAASTRALWDEGLAESEVRQRLREAGYSAPRICQLMKATRPPQAAPPPAKAAPSERKRKASNEQDDLAAALAAWPHEVVQALAAQIAEARAGVPANSHLTRATLQGFIDHVPDSVRACFPPLGALLVQLSTDDSDLPPDLAKRILTRLSAIAAQADAFWEEHPSSVASASAPTAPA
ncbi:hypothetical protein AK812_SmicGene43890 [Symbiodinium microadriaticum]|uniref:Uncharacterized protein n=1 Tax=Symbiodinium microadriaticum TaxID=2951 RepID=A0A1Q9BZV7_SYMMI|nr:hypothetical protein AK812_SmicGene43890 [Symbiodinium microadriaticum]